MSLVRLYFQRYLFLPSLGDRKAKPFLSLKKGVKELSSFSPGMQPNLLEILMKISSTKWF